jgi:hypothetical protein
LLLEAAAARAIMVVAMELHWTCPMRRSATRRNVTAYEFQMRRTSIGHAWRHGGAMNEEGVSNQKAMEKSQQDPINTSLQLQLTFQRIRVSCQQCVYLCMCVSLRASHQMNCLYSCCCYRYQKTKSALRNTRAPEPPVFSHWSSVSG